MLAPHAASLEKDDGGIGGGGGSSGTSPAAGSITVVETHYSSHLPCARTPTILAMQKERKYRVRWILSLRGPVKALRPVIGNGKCVHYLP